MRRRPKAPREGWGDVDDLAGQDRSLPMTFATTPPVVLTRLLTVGMGLHQGQKMVSLLGCCSRSVSDARMARREGERVDGAPGGARG